MPLKHEECSKGNERELQMNKPTSDNGKNHKISSEEYLTKLLDQNPDGKRCERAAEVVPLRLRNRTSEVKLRIWGPDSRGLLKPFVETS